MMAMDENLTWSNVVFKLKCFLALVLFCLPQNTDMLYYGCLSLCSSLWIYLWTVSESSWLFGNKKKVINFCFALVCCRICWRNNKSEHETAHWRFIGVFGQGRAPLHPWPLEHVDQVRRWISLERSGCFMLFLFPAKTTAETDCQSLTCMSSP